MTTTVFSMGPAREVHDINVTTTKGCRFIIDIYKNNGGFETEVTIFEPVPNNAVGQTYKTSPMSTSATDNFESAIDLIKNYISEIDSQDSIIDIHNPCNTPFINEAEQNNIIAKKGLRLTVRVN